MEKLIEKVKRGEKVYTRDGRVATIYSIMGNEPYPIVGCIGKGMPICWREDGRRFQTIDTVEDLSTELPSPKLPTKWDPSFDKFYKFSLRTAERIDTYTHLMKLADIYNAGKNNFVVAIYEHGGAVVYEYDKPQNYSLQFCSVEIAMKFVQNFKRDIIANHIR